MHIVKLQLPFSWRTCFSHKLSLFKHTIDPQYQIWWFYDLIWTNQTSRARIICSNKWVNVNFFPHCTSTSLLSRVKQSSCKYTKIEADEASRQRDRETWKWARPASAETRLATLVCFQLPPASFAPAGFEPMRRAASPLLVMRLLQSHPHSVAAWDQPLPRKQWILCPYGAYSRVRITMESLLRIPLTRLPASEIHLMAGVNAERNGGNER